MTDSPILRLSLMLLPKCVMTHAPGEWHEAAEAPDFAKLSAERCPGALEWLSRKAGPLPVIKLSGDAAEPDLGCRKAGARALKQVPPGRFSAIGQHAA